MKLAIQKIGFTSLAILCIFFLLYHGTYILQNQIPLPYEEPDHRNAIEQSINLMVQTANNMWVADYFIAVSVFIGLIIA